MRLNKKDKILIIGASGFIGANLYKYLKKNSYDVFGTYSSTKSWRLESIDKNIIRLDLLSIDNFIKIYNRLKPNVIINCSSYGAYSFEENFDLIHKVNYLSLINIFEFLKDKKIKLFINCGSSSEYGINSRAPLESDEKIPNSHYALSKVSLSYAIKYFAEKFNFPAINLRLYYVYGPYEDSSRLIPTIFNFAKNKKLPNFANKKDYKDFIFIDDLIYAFLSIFKNINIKHYGKSFNIGTNTKTSLEEVVKYSLEFFKLKIKPNYSSLNNHKWDVPDWFSNSNLFMNEFKWKPKTNFKSGLFKTFSWWVDFSEKNENINLLTKKNSNLASDKRKIAAVIACYKDSEAIPFMYERLKKVFNKIGVEYEIIFVNDCSPDDSKKRIIEISKLDKNVIGINHSRNFGSQASFLSGMKLSSSDAVVLLDGDLQDPPEVIEEFYENWLKGFDVVYGVRKKREMPVYMSILRRLFYYFFSKLSEFSIPRDAGDFSLIDKKVVTHLLDLKENDYFLRGLRAFVGFKQVGVDYFRPERMFGKTTNSFFKNIGWAKKGIFAFSVIPLHFFSAAGLLLSLFSFLSILYIVFQFFYFPEHQVKGITFISVLILFFSSIIILGIGIVGEYIGIIHYETKNRQLYIRESITRNGIIIDE